jgi:hypothetical protein
MTDDRSLERAARSWLEEGPTRAPDRPIEAALARVQTTTQERDLRVPWRYQPMNRPLQLAVGAAAAALVAILVVTVLPDRFGDVGPPSSPAVTTNESPAPSPRVLDREGPLTPGTYVTHSVFPVQVTFTVPDGWVADEVGSAITILGSDQAYLGFWIVVEAQRDPCGVGGVDISPVGPTAADLASALAAMPGFDTTGPVDVNIGGVDAEYVELIGPLPGCTDPELWRTPQRDCRCMGSDVERNRLWILDVDGSRLVVDVLPDGDAPTDSAALAELVAVLASIEISG